MSKVCVCGQEGCALFPEGYDPSTDQVVRFEYTNYKGEKARRLVIPGRIWFGSTVYHTKEQWLLHAWDINKGEVRDFAWGDMSALY